MFRDLKVNVETRPKQEEGGGGCSEMRGGERRWQRGDLSRGSKKKICIRTRAAWLIPAAHFTILGVDARRP